MTNAAVYALVLALIWAGVSLGGSLVAAPAKFRAPSLDRPTALDVGRAQFLWVGITEAALCIALIGALLLSPVAAWQWMVAPIVLFAIQRLVVMPPLDARTRRAIRGEAVGASRLHTIYVVLEILKFGALIAAALSGITSFVQ